jgi:hypothetical protein
LEEQIRNAKSVEKLLCRLDTVANGVVRWFSQQHTMFFGVDFELVKDIPPDSLHLFPVLDDAMLDGVVQLDDSLILFRLLTDEELVLLQCVDHDLLVLRPTHTSLVNYRRYLLRVEHKCRLVLSTQTRFHYS